MPRATWARGLPKAVLAIAAVSALCCTRPAAAPGLQRLAILRFENLSGEPSFDWAGRAFAEILARELAGAPSMYAISPARIHGLDQTLGPRAAAVPGISAEYELARVAGASRVGYGEYWVRNGRLEARLTLEDVPPGRAATVISASAGAGDVLAAAGSLARQIASHAVPYVTGNAAALEAYATGLDSPGRELAAERFEQAIAADPDFGPAYEALVRLKIEQRDNGGAAALLGQAAAHAGRMAAIERAQLAAQGASLRGDVAARERALAELSSATPHDPAVWRAIAEAAMSRRDYGQSVQGYEKALAVQPDDAGLLNQLGYAAAYAGDLAAATRALERYQSLRPGDVNALDSLGDVNLLFGRLREAETYYLQAAQKDPAFQGGLDLRKAAMARLMTGDANGASAPAKQFADGREKAGDPLSPYYRAEWLWSAGRRQEAYAHLEAFARAAAENAPLHEAASEAYSELAVWSVALGNRGGATEQAERAGRLAGPRAAVTAAVARLLAQPSASAEEWGARATRLFPEAAQKPLREFALAYALLGDGQFPAAAQVLKPIYDRTPPSGDENVAFLLAWAYVETGKLSEAAGLLRFNPIPPAGGAHPFQVFYFPRLFYLRGRIAAAAGSPDDAKAQFRLFLQLSGDRPLAWGEEGKAR